MTEQQAFDMGYRKGKTDNQIKKDTIKAEAICEFERICEEARSYKFGVCDADFVIDVIEAKIKEQLKGNNDSRPD